MDIFVEVRVPVSLLCVPIVCEGPMRTAHFPFPDPIDIDIPIVTTLVPPNVFTRTHTCLLNRVMSHGHGYPDRRIFVKKKTIALGHGGWKCHYGGNFRPFIIQSSPKDRNAAPSHLPCNAGRTSADCPDHLSDGELFLSDMSSAHLSDAEDSEKSQASPKSGYSDDERADDLAFWFSEDEVDIPNKRAAHIRTDTQLPITDRPRILSRQHDYAHDQLSNEIDPHKYTLLVNTLDAIVAVRWGEVERTSSLWSKYSSAKKLVDSRRKKKLSASCSSSLTRYSVGSIRVRIQQWRAWHSSSVYDARPTS